HAAQCPRDGVQGAGPLAALGQRDVDGLRRQLRLELQLLERLTTGIERLGQRLLGGVDFLTGLRALLGRQAPELLEPVREQALLAEVPDTDRVELLEVRRGGRRRLGLAHQFSESAHGATSKDGQVFASASLAASASAVKPA